MRADLGNDLLDCGGRAGRAAAGSARLGAVFANGLGDAVLALPALRALKRSAAFSRLATPVAPQLDILFDEFTDERRRIGLGPGNAFAHDQLRAALGDSGVVAFFTTGETESLRAWLNHTAGQVTSLGLSDLFGDETVQARGHYFDRYLEIARTLTGVGSLETFAYRHTCRQWAPFERDLGPRLADFDYWVLHPDTKAHKNLPASFWNQLVSIVLRRRPDTHLVVVGRDHRAFVDEMRSDRRVILAPSNFALCTYLVSHTARFCGVDSCFLHYADLQRVPSLGLVRGGADLERWGLHLTPVRDMLQIDDEAVPDAEEVAERLCGLC